MLARRQNAFFRELAEALRDELAELGIAASISTSGFPPLRQDLAYALLPPHEFFHLEGRRRPPTDEQLARTIFICAEQPETSFFGENVELAPRAHCVFDINASGVRAFAANGIAAQHFQLGYTKSWDRFGTSDDRDVDIVFLGCLSERRTRYLAGYADVLARRRTRLVLSDNSQPNYAPRENFLADDAKWELLGRSKVLLNVHQDEIRYFEWLRVVQAILNGSVVVSEHSSGHLPLVPGVHYVSGRPEALGALADGLLVDEDARRTMQLAAYEMVRDQIPLRNAVSRVAEAATEIVARPIAVAREARRARADDGTDDFPPPPPSELAVTTDADASAVRAALKEVAVDLLELRRRLTALERPDVAAAPRIVVDTRSATYLAASPRISVITSVYNHAEHLPRALESVLEAGLPVEVIVVDDGSTDDSLARAREWVERQPLVAAVVLRHPLNRGLPHGRNTGLGFARGEYSFILDADNEVYPQGLAKLVAALDADPDAAFAYGMLQLFTHDGPLRLGGTFPWEPERLRRGNYIDAMALVRTRTVVALGGYTTDRRLHGWEDYDLWCRIAERGGHAAFVPELVGRYRVSAHSMIALTNISHVAATSLLAERYPQLMGGIELPL